MTVLASSNYPFLLDDDPLLRLGRVDLDRGRGADRLFRRRDLSGWAKAAWVIFVIVLPFIGVLVYLIAYHDGMAERGTKQAEASQAQMDEYVRRTAGTGGAAGEIETAMKLLDSGTITQAEFDAIKAKALGSGAAA